MFNLSVRWSILRLLFYPRRTFLYKPKCCCFNSKRSISFESKQFIATAIFKESQNNYRAFIKELNAHIKKDFTIKLPVNLDGTPNYDYMSKYITRIKKQCLNCFEALKDV